jgi:hypothetical protein
VRHVSECTKASRRYSSHPVCRSRTILQPNQPPSYPATLGGDRIDIEGEVPADLLTLIRELIEDGTFPESSVNEFMVNAMANRMKQLQEICGLPDWDESTDFSFAVAASTARPRLFRTSDDQGPTACGWRAPFPDECRFPCLRAPRSGHFRFSQVGWWWAA